MGTVRLFRLLAAEDEAAKPAPKRWSLRPVVKPLVPMVQTRFTNPIDAFIAERHESKGPVPNGPASKLELLRRLHFDLTGLPPSIEQQTSSQWRALNEDIPHDQFVVRADRRQSPPRIHSAKRSRPTLADLTTRSGKRRARSSKPGMRSSKKRFRMLR